MALKGVIPGGPPLGTKERKKWLWTQAAYQQIPYKNLVPIEDVIKELRKWLKDYHVNYSYTVRKSECDGQMDRIEIWFDASDFHFSWDPLNDFLKKYKFRAVQIFNFKHPVLLIVRHRTYAVKSK